MNERPEQQPRIGEIGGVCNLKNGIQRIAALRGFPPSVHPAMAIELVRSIEGEYSNTPQESGLEQFFEHHLIQHTKV